MAGDFFKNFAEVVTEDADLYSAEKLNEVDTNEINHGINTSTRSKISISSWIIGLILAAAVILAIIVY